MPHTWMSPQICLFWSVSIWYIWEMSHLWMSHVTHISASCHTYECVMSHIWMSHVPRMMHWYAWHSFICHTYETHVTHMNGFAWSSGMWHLFNCMFSCFTIIKQEQGQNKTMRIKHVRSRRYALVWHLRVMLNTHKHVYVQTICVCIHRVIHICIYVCIPVRLVRICIHMDIQICVYICVCLCMCVCVYVFMYPYI